MADGELNTRAGMTYMRQLDALRALAIVTVLMEHWLPHGHPLRIISRWGTPGVYLFFVLSGFLITDILLRGRDAVDAGTVSRIHVLRQFYIRRFLRIFPIYYAALAVGCMLDLPQMRAAWMWHAAYLSNFWLAQLPAGEHAGPSGVFWTLAVEEQFYLVWPLLILLLPRRAMFWGVLMVMLSAPVAGYFAYSAGFWSFTLMTPFAFQFFGAGALVAVLRWQPQRAILSERGLGRLMLVIGAAGAIAIEWHGKGQPYTLAWWFVLLGRPLALAMLFAWLIGICARGVRGPVGRLLEWGPVIYLGRISYGVYVYHLLVLFAVPTMLGWVGLWTPLAERLTTPFAGRLVLTLGAAALSWHFFESPINGLKRFFPYLDRRPRQARAPVSTELPAAAPPLETGVSAS